MWHRVERSLELLSALLLIAPGLVGIAVSAAALAGWSSSISTASTLTLFILSALGVGIGIDRSVTFHRLNSRLDRHEDTLKRLLGGRVLRGHEENYREGGRLCSDAERGIRTFVAGGQKAPETFAEAVATRLRDRVSAANPIVFYVVLAVDFEKIPADFSKGVDERQKIYKRQQVSHLVHLRLIDQAHSTGPDALIVDAKHVLLGISTTPGLTATQTGILFEDSPALAEAFAHWFDHVVWPRAIPYEDWLPAHQLQSSAKQP